MPTLMRRALTAPYAPETKALLGRMSSPASGVRARLIDKTIRSLKNNGLWDVLDLFYMVAAHDAQAARLNWKGNASFNLTATNSPTFTIDRGYAGNASNMYLASGWIIGVNGVNAVQDSTSLGCYVNGGTDAGALKFVAGWNYAGPNSTYIVPWNTDNTIRYRVNNSSSMTSSATMTTNRGLSVIERTGASACESFRNGVSVNTASAASGGVEGTVALNLIGDSTGSNYSDMQVACAWVGAGLGTTKQAAIYSIIYRYLSQIGAA